MAASHVFSSNPIDRVQDLRRDPAWIEAQRSHPGARYLPFRELRPAVRQDDTARLAWLDAPAALRAGGAPSAVLLGLHDGAPLFAFTAAEGDEAEPGASFVDARAVGALLPSYEAGILAQARSMLDWHTRLRFCPSCGGPLEVAEAGARRACTACGARHYPQVAPSIIVLVEREGLCLLARRAGANTNRHSCLAGYVEPGESLEEAVVREVFEESGVRVGEVRYHSSQPWPFPATLMIGCTATALSADINVDGVEIASAGWFSRDDARRALEGTNPDLSIPDPVAIAHHLVRDWVEQRA